MTALDGLQASACDGVPASVVSLLGQHDYTLSDWHEAKLRMMQGIELKRRGLRFLPRQTIKRALRLHIHTLKLQDPPEYLVPLANLSLRAHERDGDKNTQGPLD